MIQITTQMIEMTMQMIMGIPTGSVDFPGSNSRAKINLTNGKKIEDVLIDKVSLTGIQYTESEFDSDGLCVRDLKIYFIPWHAISSIEQELSQC